MAPLSIHLSVISTTDLKLSATLTNTGPTPLKIMKVPQTILFEHPPTKVFKIAPAPAPAFSDQTQNQNQNQNQNTFDSDSELEDSRDPRSRRAPPFIGAMLKFLSPERVAQSGFRGSFVFLDPGESVTVVHKLDDMYDFAKAGPGRYVVKPATYTFLVVDEEKEIERVLAEGGVVVVEYAG